MNKKSIIIGFIIVLVGAFMITRNPGVVETGCWDYTGCDHFGRGYVWVYAHNFGILAWTGTFITAVGSAYFSQGFFPKKADLALRALFAVLAFCFAMTCIILGLINS